MFKIFQRPKIEENKRPQQFLKRHASIPQQSRSSPFIDFVELSEREKPVYESWWRDLDPFNFEEINHQTVLKFLNGCSLEQSKLEQVRFFFFLYEYINKKTYRFLLCLIQPATIV